MKKTMFIFIAMLGLSHVAKADNVPAVATVSAPAITTPATLATVSGTSTVTFPTTAQNSFLNGQVIPEIINHGTFAEEYRSGQKQVILSDNIIEAGHLNAQYIVGVDVGLYQNPLKTNLDYEAGVRLNLNSIVNRFVAFTPQWQSILGNLEYYPRAFYDFGQDQAHAWNVSFNLGLGFGPGAGIPSN
jgi:hypothetical protein